MSEVSNEQILSEVSNIKTSLAQSGGSGPVSRDYLDKKFKEAGEAQSKKDEKKPPSQFEQLQELVGIKDVVAAFKDNGPISGITSIVSLLGVKLIDFEHATKELVKRATGGRELRPNRFGLPGLSDRITPDPGTDPNRVSSAQLDTARESAAQLATTLQTLTATLRQVEAAANGAS